MHALHVHAIPMRTAGKGCLSGSRGTGGSKHPPHPLHAFPARPSPPSPFLLLPRSLAAPPPFLSLPPSLAPHPCCSSRLRADLSPPASTPRPTPTFQFLLPRRLPAFLVHPASAVRSLHNTAPSLLDPHPPPPPAPPLPRSFRFLLPRPPCRAPPHLSPKLV
eukprot:364192-Chlamydomonas_euryale.AAC.6